jgi:hypothetical protein
MFVAVAVAVLKPPLGLAVMVVGMEVCQRQRGLLGLRILVVVVVAEVLMI